MLRHARVAVVAAIAIIGGCKKDEGGAAPSQAAKRAELVQRPAAIDLAKVSVPALFAHVPADTPYMVGSFESFPLNYWSKVAEVIGPTYGAALAKLLEEPSEGSGLDPTVARLLMAVQEEMGGQWTAQGLEKLGFKPTARFAFYGLGLQPIVFRFEVDSDKLRSSIDRITQRAQLTLPPRPTHQGREHWRFTKRDTDLVVAIADDQLVIAFGKSADVEASLGLILGTDKPPASMADGKVLADIAAKHGFGPQLIGFLDLTRVAHAALASSGAPASEACTVAIGRVAARAPRTVFGYSPLSGDVWSGGLVVELAPDLIAELKNLEVELPGLDETITDRALMAMGMALDLERGRKLLLQATTSLRDAAAACELPEAVEKLTELEARVSTPLPDAATNVSGFGFALEQLSFSGGPMPDKVEAVGFVAAKDGKALFDDISKLVPIGQLGVAADGKLHQLAGLPIPIPVHAGVGDRALVVAAGGGSSLKLAEKVLAARPSGTAPLLVVSYDYAWFIELQAQINQMSGVDDPLVQAQQQLSASVAKLFGRVSGSLDVTDQGLAFWSSMQVK